MCPECQATAVHWIEANGAGRVYSWVVATHPVLPVLTDQVPYVIAIIELDEGVRLVANIVDSAPSDVEADMRVSVIFERSNDGIVLPNFRRYRG